MFQLKPSSDFSFVPKEKNAHNHRLWDKNNIPLSQLPPHIIKDPVLWSIFKRLHYEDKNLLGVIVGETGCQPLGSKVLMANYTWRNVEDVKEGDKVLSPDYNGKLKIETVLNTTVFFDKNIYDVYDVENKKIVYSCSHNHIIPFVRSKSSGLVELRAKKFAEFCNLKQQFFSYVYDPVLQKNRLIEVKCHKRIGFDGCYFFGFGITGKTNWFVTNDYMITHNSGKSISAISFAKALDVTPIGNGDYLENFVVKCDENGNPSPETRIVFSATDFIRLVKSKLPKGSVIIWDEAGIGNDNTTWNDKRSRLVKHVMQSFRAQNLCVFLTVPDLESVTVGTRRLMHLLCTVVSRSDKFATVDLRWIVRNRNTGKDLRPFFCYEDENGERIKLNSYKIPKLDSGMELEYNKIKSNILGNINKFYENEMVAMEKLEVEKQERALEDKVKVRQFVLKDVIKEFEKNRDKLHYCWDEEKGRYDVYKLQFVLSEWGFEGKTGQARQIAANIKPIE
jgi:hypothetical protein